MMRVSAKLDMARFLTLPSTLLGCAVFLAVSRDIALGRHLDSSRVPVVATDQDLRGVGLKHGPFLLELEQPVVGLGNNPTVTTNYHLTNRSTNRRVILHVRFAPHKFASLMLREMGKLDLKEPQRTDFGGPGNTWEIEPGGVYSATSHLDKVFELSQPGTYTLRVRTTVDTSAIDDNLIGMPCTLTSNDVTFTIK